MQIFVHPKLFDLTKDFENEVMAYKGGTFRVQSSWDLMHVLYTNYFFLKKIHVPLHSVIMRHKYGTYYNKIIEYLEDNGLIEKTKEYMVGERARSYSLVDVTTPPIMMELKDKVLLKRRGHGIHTGDTVPELYRPLIDGLNDIELDVTAEELSQYHFSVSWMVTCIRNKEWFWSIDGNGRLHTPMTVLKKNLREKITIRGENIEGVDICNSQPLFLSILMKKSGTIDHKWIKSTIEGTVYEEIAKTMDCSRKIAKEMVFRCLFGHNSGSMIYDKVISETFPLAYEWIRVYKKEDHTLLANDLQKLESEWMYSVMVPYIMENGFVPIFTVHDSIYFRESDSFIKTLWDKEILKLHGLLA